MTMVNIQLMQLQYVLGTRNFCTAHAIVTNSYMGFFIFRSTQHFTHTQHCITMYVHEYTFQHEYFFQLTSLPPSTLWQVPYVTAVQGMHALLCLLCICTAGLDLEKVEVGDLSTLCSRQQPISSQCNFSFLQCSPLQPASLDLSSYTFWSLYRFVTPAWKRIKTHNKKCLTNLKRET